PRPPRDAGRGARARDPSPATGADPHERRPAVAKEPRRPLRQPPRPPRPAPSDLLGRGPQRAPVRRAREQRRRGRDRDPQRDHAFLPEEGDEAVGAVLERRRLEVPRQHDEFAHEEPAEADGANQGIRPAASLDLGDGGVPSHLIHSSPRMILSLQPPTEESNVLTTPRSAGVVGGDAELALRLRKEIADVYGSRPCPRS